MVLIVNYIKFNLMFFLLLLSFRFNCYERTGRASDLKSSELVCWWWWFDWSFARLIAPVVATTSIILCSNKIQNGDILVPANPGLPGKMAVKIETDKKETDTLFCCVFRRVVQYTCDYWMTYRANVSDIAAVTLERLQVESDMVLLRAVDCILSAQRFVFVTTFYVLTDSDKVQREMKECAEDLIIIISPIMVVQKSTKQNKIRN